MTNNNNNQNNIDILKDLRQGFAECFNRSRQITENINSSRGHLNTLNLRFTAEAKATIYSQQDELVDDLNQLTADAKKQFNILDREIRSGNNITNDFINDATINLMELNHRVNEADAKRDYLTAYFHGNLGEYKNRILLKIDEINHVIKNELTPKAKSLKNIRMDSGFKEDLDFINSSIASWNDYYTDLHKPNNDVNDNTTKSIHKTYIYGTQIINYYSIFYTELENAIKENRDNSNNVSFNEISFIEKYSDPKESYLEYCHSNKDTIGKIIESLDSTMEIYANLKNHEPNLGKVYSDCINELEIEKSSYINLDNQYDDTIYAASNKDKSDNFFKEECPVIEDENILLNNYLDELNETKSYFGERLQSIIRLNNTVLPETPNNPLRTDNSKTNTIYTEGTTSLLRRADSENLWLQPLHHSPRKS